MILPEWRAEGGKAVAFFDNIGKKISDLGQGAMTKTRDLADSARTSAAISDEERKINSYYSQLG